MSPYQYLNIIYRNRFGFIKLGWINEVLLNYDIINSMILQCTQTVPFSIYWTVILHLQRGKVGRISRNMQVFLTACFPHTKLLHLVHLCSHFLSYLRGHERHRPRFFAGFVAHRLGAGCTPIANMAIATDGWCEIDELEARCVINGSTSLSATSVRKRRRLSRRVEPIWFFDCGFFRFHTTNAFRQG